MNLPIIDNFLSSGHHFSEDDNLQKFRFSLLNSNLLIASFFTFLNYFSSIFGFIQFAPIYEKTLLFYALTCFIGIFPLRMSKRNYSLVANTALLSSLILFYCALLIGPLTDEFRLIWFFLVVLASFVLMGKRYGLTLMLLIMFSLIIINQYFELGFSDVAEFTFFNSFIIFTAFAYFFLSKIEKDAVEFRLLNNALKESVRKEVEQREKQEQMLLQQYRMANIGGMLDAIAHQWRQPLMNINAVLMNMDHSLRSDQNNTHYLVGKVDEVSLLTDHMSQTIDDFRSLLKVEKTQKLISIESAVNDVLVLMKNSLNEISVNCHVENSIDIVGHKSELMQVIIILLSNAIETMTKRQIENRELTITIKAFDKEVLLEIEDNAGGITEANLAVIFDPYFTTKEQSGGTGLGLYIAKIIIEQKMVGQITASNTDRGAKFTLQFSIS